MSAGPTGGGGIPTVTTLVGRGGEVRQVREALRNGHTVVISGAAGLGRTALARAALHTRAVAWGGGLATVPRRAYLALERALSEEAPPQVTAGGGPGRPEVGRLNDDDIDVVADWVGDRLSGRTLVVDDLHLTHPATPAVLARLAGAIPLVVALSSDHPRAGSLRRDVLGWPGGRVVVELAPLDRGSAARLVLRHAPELDGDGAVRLAVAVGGSPRQLEKAALAAALAGRSGPIPPVSGPVRALSGLGPALTPRESEVLGLIASGSTTAEIARRLDIATCTVESHVRAVRTKLGVPTRAAAVALGAAAHGGVATPVTGTSVTSPTAVAAWAS